MDKEIKLRCYIKKDGDLWIAMCVDLCLASQSEDIEVAMQNLGDQVMEYMYDITEGDLKDEYDNLFPRKAPLSVMVDYHLTYLTSKLRKLFGSKGGSDQSQFFNKSAAH